MYVLVSPIKNRGTKEPINEKALTEWPPPPPPPLIMVSGNKFALVQKKLQCFDDQLLCPPLLFCSPNYVKCVFLLLLCWRVSLALTNNQHHQPLKYFGLTKDWITEILRPHKRLNWNIVASQKIELEYCGFTKDWFTEILRPHKQTTSSGVSVCQWEISNESGWPYHVCLWFRILHYLCVKKQPTSSATEILLTTLKHSASHVYLSLARTAYLATNGHHQ